MYCLVVGDENFDHFPLFDETLRHLELCTSVVSQMQRNQKNLSNSVDSSFNRFNLMSNAIYKLFL